MALLWPNYILSGVQTSRKSLAHSLSGSRAGWKRLLRCILPSCLTAEFCEWLQSCRKSHIYPLFTQQTLNNWFFSFFLKDSENLRLLKFPFKFIFYVKYSKIHSVWVCNSLRFDKCTVMYLQRKSWYRVVATQKFSLYFPRTLDSDLFLHF